MKTTFNTFTTAIVAGLLLGLTLVWADKAQALPFDITVTAEVSTPLNDVFFATWGPYAASPANGMSIADLRPVADIAASPDPVDFNFSIDIGTAAAPEVFSMIGVGPTSSVVIGYHSVIADKIISGGFGYPTLYPTPPAPSEAVLTAALQAGTPSTINDFLFGTFFSGPPDGPVNAWAAVFADSGPPNKLIAFSKPTEVGTLTVSTAPAAPVPEPATMLLLGIGLAGIAGKGLRSHKKNLVQDLGYRGHPKI